MDATFDFRLIELDGPLGQQVQAVWSASVSIHSEPVTKPLFSDGASGAFIILKGEVMYHDQTYKQGVHWIPVKKQAQFITMSAGVEMVGFRFHPAKNKDHYPIFHDDFGYVEEFQNIHTDKGLFAILLNAPQPERLTLLCKWLEHNIKYDISNNALLSFIGHIDHKAELQSIEKLIPLSLRQIERQFKSQVGFTPKYYQRLMRIRQAIHLIREYPTMSLVDLATQAGFSDQAHMNREFRKLAGMTPKEYQISKQ